MSVFESEEARTLDSVLALLIPSNVPPGSPGAREANVIGYVDRELQKPFLTQVKAVIRRALIALTEASKRDEGMAFAALAPAAQERMLDRFQANSLAFGKNIDTGNAFNQIRALAFEGFLGDPKHGGNANAVAWTWLDLPIHVHH